MTSTYKRPHELTRYDVIMYNNCECCVAKPTDIVVRGFSDVITLEHLTGGKWVPDISTLK